MNLWGGQSGAKVGLYVYVGKLGSDVAEGNSVRIAVGDLVGVSVLDGAGYRVGASVGNKHISLRHKHCGPPVSLACGYISLSTVISL